MWQGRCPEKTSCVLWVTLEGKCCLHKILDQPVVHAEKPGKAKESVSRPPAAWGKRQRDGARNWWISGQVCPRVRDSEASKLTTFDLIYLQRHFGMPIANQMCGCIAFC
jgi:hypothetical protein